MLVSPLCVKKLWTTGIKGKRSQPIATPTFAHKLYLGPADNSGMPYRTFPHFAMWRPRLSLCYTRRALRHSWPADAFGLCSAICNRADNNGSFNSPSFDATESGHASARTHQATDFGPLKPRMPASPAPAPLSATRGGARSVDAVDYAKREGFVLTGTWTKGYTPTPGYVHIPFVPKRIRTIGHKYSISHTTRVHYACRPRRATNIQEERSIRKVNRSIISQYIIF